MNVSKGDMTEAVDDAYRELVDIHNRQYQKLSIDRRIYLVPVDENEEDRQVVHHRMLHELFEERLFFPIITYPRRVLDCGYGRGQWAVALAQCYDQAEVTAIDIFPADLPDAPDNLACEVWDLNETLSPTYPSNYYDLIHSRCVAPGIKKDRWRSYLRDLKRLLRSGGWVQLVEYYYIIQSDSGQLTAEHALQQWSDGYRAAMEQDRDPRVGRHLANMLTTAGYTEVQERSYRVPLGGWPADATQRNIGLLNVENMAELIDSHGLWHFTHRYGWTAAQFETLTDRAREEMADPTLKLYVPLTVAWGKKR